MRFSRMLALGASMLVLLSACSTGGGSKPTIKIGSVGFDEARVVAEIYAQALEANGYAVDRAGIGLGNRKVLLPALESGQIDLQPEYVGSGLAYYGGAPEGHADTNKELFADALKAKGLAISILDYTPGEDTNAFVVRKETADQFGISKLSEIGAVQDQLKWAFATDCPTNPLCAAALKAAYDIAPKDVTLLDACSGPMAEALLQKTVDVAELCSTQPEIITNAWVILDDDRATQPADSIVPLVRDDLLAKVDKAAFSKILNDISEKIDTPTLGQLYYDVAVGKKDIKDVASAWLKANGFVK